MAKIIITVIIILCMVAPTLAEECEYSKSKGVCHHPKEALSLKLVAIGSILVASMIGVCLPLLTRSIQAFHPDKGLFTIVKAFASGVILATGYMHVLPDSIECLQSPCLPQNPWRNFPFTTFVAMLSAVAALMVDSFAMSYHNTAKPLRDNNKVENDDKVEEGGAIEKGSQQLLRHRVVAQVLEAGIVVHSVVIGLSMGTSGNVCTIRPLIAALCFHQLFEGMGLGGCILKAEYGTKVKAVMVMFFSGTTPLGIALATALIVVGLLNASSAGLLNYMALVDLLAADFLGPKTYSPNSPTALIVVGLLNASSAGLLNYMALVDLLAADFLGPKLQQSVRLQFKAYVAVLLGAGGMSVMAIWA